MATRVITEAQMDLIRRGFALAQEAQNRKSRLDLTVTFGVSVLHVPVKPRWLREPIVEVSVEAVEIPQENR